MISNTTANRPIVFIDVDGVLNPFAEPRFLKPFGFKRHRILDNDSNTKYTMWLNREHAEWLKSLTDIADLAWSTTWNDSANHIGYIIGLPPLPFAQAEHCIGIGGKKFTLKSKSIIELANGRPIIWIDDDHDGHDQGFMKNNATKFALIHVPGFHGLQPYHINDIRKTIELWK